MKYALMVILCLSTMALAADDITGFRGLEWGTPPPDGMEFVQLDESYGGIRLCQRAGDAMKIGGAEVTAILYGYWQGRLSNVIIRTSGYGNYQSLLSATNEKYGKGGQPNEYIEHYYWSRASGHGLMNYNEFDQKCDLFIISEKISEEQEAWDAARAHEGKKDF